MRKIIILLFILFCDNVYAINNITIDNEELIPKYDSNIKVYNYYTNKEKVIIKIDNKTKELYLEDNKNNIIIDEYTINIFKNYNKNEEEVYLTNLIIDGYDIDFDMNKYEYYIEINDEDNLNINYELSNDTGYVSITGNGNFNKSDNIITINVNNKDYYRVHAYKTMKVSLINNHKEKIVIKKEIAKYIVITISCILIFLFTYLMFNKNHFYI